MTLPAYKRHRLEVADARKTLIKARRLAQKHARADLVAEIDGLLADTRDAATEIRRLVKSYEQALDRAGEVLREVHARQVALRFATSPSEIHTARDQLIEVCERAETESFARRRLRETGWHYAGISETETEVLI